MEPLGIAAIAITGLGGYFFAAAKRPDGRTMGFIIALMAMVGSLFTLRSISVVVYCLCAYVICGLVGGILAAVRGDNQDRRRR